MAEVIARSRARGIARLVLVALAERANGSFQCWPSIRTLVIATGLHRTTILRALRRLTALGEIVCQPRHRRSTIYRITLPGLSSGERLKADGTRKIRVAESDAGGSGERLKVVAESDSEPVREPVNEPGGRRRAPEAAAGRPGLGQPPLTTWTGGRVVPSAAETSAMLARWDADEGLAGDASVRLLDLYEQARGRRAPSGPAAPAGALPPSPPARRRAARRRRP